MTTLPHPALCVQCAAQGPTCCTLTNAGDEEFCFPLPEQERARILATDARLERYFLSAPNTPAFVQQLGVLLTDYAVHTAFPESGFHWRLAITQDRHCVFLGPTGCVLDRTLRPTYCRIFPLWVLRGQVTWFTAPQCLISTRCQSAHDMFTAMRTTRAEILSLFSTMCAGLHLSKVTP
ncbi:hypothetical protein MASR1M90_01440 [Desulfovibrionales bacterium]